MSNHVPTPYECSNRNWRNEVDWLHYYITGDRHMSYDTNPDDEDGEIESGESCTSVAVVPGNATSGRITKDTAEFIVRACNSHDDLLTACKRMLAAMDDSSFGGEGNDACSSGDFYPSITFAASIIAKVEAGKCQEKSS